VLGGWATLVTLAAVVGLVVGDDPDRQVALARRLNTATGVDLVRVPEAPGGAVPLAEVFSPSVLRGVALVGLVVLCLAVAGWAAAVRSGTRAVSATPPWPRSAPPGLPLTVLVAAGLWPVALTACLVGVAAVASTERVASVLGLGSSTAVTVAVGAVALLLLLLVNVAGLVILSRWVAGIPVPARDLAGTVLPCSGWLVLLTLAGGLLLTATAGTPVALLLVLVLGPPVLTDLAARGILLTAAARAELSRERLGPETRRSLSGRSVPVGPAVPLRPRFGPRTEDRVALGAGVVLGAVGMVGLGTLRGAARRLLRRG
jgi:uncharacterized BrkB/YihY/UPF0761 family membrane protein